MYQLGNDEQTHSTSVTTWPQQRHFVGSVWLLIVLIVPLLMFRKIVPLDAEEHASIARGWSYFHAHSDQRAGELRDLSDGRRRRGDGSTSRLAGAVRRARHRRGSDDAA